MKKTGFFIAFLIAIASEDFFVFLMMTLDVLPLKYVLVLLLLIGILDAAIAIPLFRKKYGGTAKLAGLVVFMLTLNVMLLGSYVMYNTYVTLDNISKQKDHYEQYDVVVLENSKYQDVDNIKGQKVFAFSTDSKMYDEAMQKLDTKANVRYDILKDCNAVANKLLIDKDKTNDVITFVPDNNYQVLCEENKKFKDNTKILYTVNVIINGSNKADRVNVTEGPFNIYITGIDMWGKIDQVSRSDVNMIMTVNPKDRTILLTSMPRDSYVILHSSGEYDKLTHTGVWGVEETIQTVEDWLDTDINYFIRVDFSMLIDIVEAIDGIDVYSDYTFKSSLRDYHYTKGWNHLGGWKALYFARERHAFKNEDQQRILNQQKVMKACIRKVTKSKTLLTHYTDLLDVVKDEMETNLSNEEIAALVRMQLDDMSGWKFDTQAIQGDLAMKGTYTMGMDRKLLVSIPREKSVEKVRARIKKALAETKEQ